MGFSCVCHMCLREQIFFSFYYTKGAASSRWVLNRPCVAPLQELRSGTLLFVCSVNCLVPDYTLCVYVGTYTVHLTSCGWINLCLDFFFHSFGIRICNQWIYYSWNNCRIRELEIEFWLSWSYFNSKFKIMTKPFTHFTKINYFNLNCWYAHCNIKNLVQPVCL